MSANGEVITKAVIKKRLDALMEAFDGVGAEQYDALLKEEQKREEAEIDAEVRAEIVKGTLPSVE